MATKIINPKQATKELERRFREESQRLRQEPAEGSEGYTNVYLEDEPEQREEEQPTAEPEVDQSSTPQPRIRQRRFRRPAEVEEAVPSPEQGGQPAPPEAARPLSGAGQPTSAVPSEQLSRGAQFAERTKALQQAAGAVKQAAQVGRAVAATARAAAVLGQVAVFLVSPAMWPVWIGLAIAAGIFLVVFLVVAVACTYTPDWVPPYGMTRTLVEAIRSLVNAFSGIPCT